MLKGFPWTSVGVSHGLPWSSVEFHGLPWVPHGSPTGCHWYLMSRAWVSIGSHGIPWFSHELPWTFMGRPWSPIYLPWISHGLPMDVIHGCPVGLPWLSHGLPWTSMGRPMSLPLVSRGSPMGHPWVSRESPVDLSWIRLGSPMGVHGLPLESHRRSIGCHGTPTWLRWALVRLPWVSRDRMRQNLLQEKMPTMYVTLLVSSNILLYSNPIFFRKSQTPCRPPSPPHGVPFAPSGGSNLPGEEWTGQIVPCPWRRYLDRTRTQRGGLSGPALPDSESLALS